MCDSNFKLCVKDCDSESNDRSDYNRRYVSRVKFCTADKSHSYSDNEITIEYHHRGGEIERKGRTPWNRDRCYHSYYTSDNPLEGVSLHYNHQNSILLTDFYVMSWDKSLDMDAQNTRSNDGSDGNGPEFNVLKAYNKDFICFSKNKHETFDRRYNWGVDFKTQDNQNKLVNGKCLTSFEISHWYKLKLHTKDDEELSGTNDKVAVSLSTYDQDYKKEYTKRKKFTSIGRNDFKEVMSFRKQLHSFDISIDGGDGLLMDELYIQQLPFQGLFQPSIWPELSRREYISSESETICMSSDINDFDHRTDRIRDVCSISMSYKGIWEFLVSTKEGDAYSGSNNVVESLVLDTEGKQLEKRHKYKFDNYGDSTIIRTNRPSLARLQILGTGSDATLIDSIQLSYKSIYNDDAIVLKENLIKNGNSLCLSTDYDDYSGLGTERLHGQCVDNTTFNVRPNIEQFEA